MVSVNEKKMIFVPINTGHNSEGGAERRNAVTQCLNKFSAESSVGKLVFDRRRFGFDGDHQATPPYTSFAVIE